MNDLRKITIWRSLMIALSGCVCLFSVAAQQVADYHVVWNTQSANSGESMPCGGGDIGLNVWVENGDILFYMAKSGTFDENNTLLKQGRVRIQLSPNPFDGETFRQELNLEEGCVLISGKNNSAAADVRIWVDVFQPVIHVETASGQPLAASILYENWRHQDRPIRKGEGIQSSYRWAMPPVLITRKDEVAYEGDKILFYHHNKGETAFDVTVKQQGLERVKDQLFDPLKDLASGGLLEAKGFKPAGTTTGTYINTDYKAWKLESEKPLKKWNMTIKLHTEQTPDITLWKKNLDKPAVSDRKKNLAWWTAFNERSFIRITSHDGTDKGFELSRNYQLFRYMLACNAYGQYPTKFNGGLFTYDPAFVGETSAFTPDFRAWGGGTFTAQNQRLVYFPMLKSGDFDWMAPQLDFYMRILKTAEIRSQAYWGHEGACFTEQIENFGLPNLAEYSYEERPDKFDNGLEYNAWLEYLWDTALEIGYLALEKERYAGADISEYLPLAESVLRFFDEHYQYLAKIRGRRTFDEKGKLILYPGSACETYKMAYNSTSTIAALQTVASRLLELPERYLTPEKRAYYEQFLQRLPEIRTREIDGHTTIAPAWQWERVNNVETPQLYPVWPWGIYGIGKPGLDIAINTYLYDPHALQYRDHISWHQDAIFAARLGLAEEAKTQIIKKLQDSGRRFPTFWGPGHDWTPDHNWGGSGMIALQEMLLQNNGDELLLLPAWPKDWDVHFKLFAPNNKVVECRYINNEIKTLTINGQPQPR
ncbi:MAG: DUF5703 domain-containing protein [Tannerellaceae bacterium]|nr:DUF5703 domain-containing protein [Tannerellaceae bacterium]